MHIHEIIDAFVEAIVVSMSNTGLSENTINFYV